MRQQVPSTRTGEPLLRAEISRLECAVADLQGNSVPPHIALLALKNELGVAYLADGQPEDALSVWNQILADCARVFGRDHPNTLIVAGNIAVALATIDPSTALGRIEYAVTRRLQSLGPRHPATIAARNALAACYRSSGHVREALSQSQLAQQLAQAVVGPHHTATLAAWNGQAAAYALLGEAEIAEELLRALLADCEHLLGAGDAMTQSVRLSLAQCHRSRSDLKGAQKLLRRTLAGYQVTLGAHHPATAAAQAQLDALNQAIISEQDAATEQQMQEFRDLQGDRMEKLRSLMGLTPVEAGAPLGTDHDLDERQAVIDPGEGGGRSASDARSRRYTTPL